MPYKKKNEEEIEGYDESRRLSHSASPAARRNADLGLVPNASNPNLLDDGEANPIYSWRNRATYRFESPREEYVQSLEAVTMRGLAKKWGVPSSTMAKWCRVGKWGLERQAFWNGVAKSVEKLNQDSIAQTRTMEMADRLSMWRGMKAQIMGTMATGLIREMSAKGFYIERPMNPGDYKDVAIALSKIDSEIDKAMGIAGWSSKQGEGDGEAFGISRITNIAFNFSGPPKQLNEGGMANEVPEAEVVEPMALPAPASPPVEYDEEDNE